jgi:hypothetical protein
MDTIDQVQEQETALTEKQKVKALRARKKQEAEEKLARDPFLPSPENPPTETAQSDTGGVPSDGGEPAGDPGEAVRRVRISR